MRLLTSLLLPAFLGAASAVSDAPVYIFQGDEWATTPTPHTLTTDQARLVFSQRLGTSQRHSLEEANDADLWYINKFGGRRDSLFQVHAQDKIPELLLVIGGVSSDIAETLLKSWESITPAFSISTPLSFNGEEFVLDGRVAKIATPSQACLLEEAINPFDERCWPSKMKSMYFELDCENSASRIEDLMAVQERMLRFAKNGELNIAVALMPKSSKLSKCRQGPPHGSQAHLGRREHAEEPITELPESSSAPPFYSKQLKTSNTTFDDEPITGVPALCHSSLDSCVSATNNCSGHGECYKYGSANDTDANDTDASPACFKCGCIAQNETFSLENGKKGSMITYWGGAACHKKDVSGPFWLIAIFSVVMVGLVSWSIGLLFSIGEEKLPGVIGAGVSSKTR